MKIWANIPSPAAWRCEIWLMWVLTRGDDECSVVSASCYHVRRNWIWEEPAGRRKLWKEKQENNSSASFRCYKITTTLVHPTRPIFVFFFLLSKISTNDTPEPNVFIWDGILCSSAIFCSMHCGHVHTTYTHTLITFNFPLAIIIFIVLLCFVPKLDTQCYRHVRLGTSWMCYNNRRQKQKKKTKWIIFSFAVR